MIVEERTSAVALDPTRVRPGAKDAWEGATSAVLRLLPLAGVTELLLMRTFYRVGIFIPKRGAFPTIYSALTTIGSFALNLSSVLVLVALALLAARGIRERSETAGWALAAFAAVSLVLAASGERELGPVARLCFGLAVASVAWPFLRSEAAAIDRFVVAAVASVVLVSSYAALGSDVQALAPDSATPGGLVGAQLVAEALTVVAAFAFCGAWVRRRELRLGPLAAGAFACAGLLALWSANGAVTGIVVLWTVGLRLYLPMWLYSLAFGAFVAGAVGARRRTPWRSAGMTLLLVGGILFGSTYAQALALVGLVLVTDGWAVGGLPGIPRQRV